MKQQRLLTNDIHFTRFGLTVKEPREWSKSRIIQGDHEAQKKLTVYLDPVQDGKKTWELCFRASEHQYSAYAFHAYCDHRGPTVTLVRVGKDVFGGYADKSWEGDDGKCRTPTRTFKTFHRYFLCAIKLSRNM